MGRGGRRKERDEPERRCLATGRSGPSALLIRFALSPDGAVTPDLAEKLPGRGAWVSAERAALEKVAKKNLFSRAFKTKALVTEPFLSQIEDLLVKRACQGLALCRKAGAAVAGFEKVKETLLRAEWDGPEGEERALGVTLVQASDGAADGRRKLSRMAPPDRVLTAMTGSELGLAFGRPCVIHAALLESGAATRAIRDMRRLAGVRGAENSDRGDDADAPRSGSSEPHRKQDAAR